MSTTSLLVPIEQVRATAMSLIENADTMDRAYFDEWIYLGLKEIGPNTAWVSPVTTLYPNHLEILKPKDMASPISLALFDANGNEMRYVHRGKGGRTHLSGNSNLDSSIYAPEFGAPIDLSEDGYYFHLGSNGASVSYAKVVYWKLPVDENGKLLVPDTDVLALSMFVRYMWMIRKDDKAGIGQAKNIWIPLRNEARATHAMPSMMEGADMARSFNSMIQKMRYKIF